MSDRLIRMWRDFHDSCLALQARQRGLWAICLGIIYLAFAELHLQIKDGLHLFEFDDEMGTLVIAKMIVHGKHIYRDIFDTHGPVPLMMTHLYASLVSDSDFSYVRLFQVILATISSGALVSSAAFEKLLTRIWAGALYIIFLSYVWNVEGFNLIWYDTVAGFFLVVLVAQLVVPLVVSREPRLYGTFTSGLASGLAFFCALSNLIAIFFLILSSAVLAASMPNRERIPRHVKAFSLGLLSAILLVGGWILKFGDIPGYFVYHFYFNIVVHKAFSLHNTLMHLVPSLDPPDVIQTTAFFFDFCWISILVWLEKSRNSTGHFRLKVTALAFMALGVVSSNLLGRQGCADASPVNCSFALLSMSSALLLQKSLREKSARPVLMSVAVTGSAIILTNMAGRHADLWFGAKRSEMDRYYTELAPGHESIYRFIQLITKEEDDFLALPWKATNYIKTARLPASGTMNYWYKQAVYDRHPILGYKIDLCADMSARKPAVIWFFFVGEGETAIDEYEPCVLAFVAAGYTPVSFGSPWYIRNDILQMSLKRLPRDADTQSVYQATPTVLRPTRPLTASSPIKITMSPTHLDREVALRRIGIMLTTNRGPGRGDVELRLEGPNGASFVRRVTLTEIADNRYHFFDVQAGRYTKGELHAGTGEGISAWESHFDLVYTCAIFEYVDGTRRYTPACPIM